MRAPCFILLFLLMAGVVGAQSTYVRLSTNKGDIVVMLYDATPAHRDMFVKGIKNGTYKNALFNRVIKSFVSQGGELDETILNREKENPELPVKRLAPEIKSELFHKQGALGAGRDDNPEKSSYLSQIYLVQGKKQTDDELDAIEKKKGNSFSAFQRMVYKEKGGCPRLDGDYTIFGEIVSGLDVADAINVVPTDAKDIPLQAIKFHAEILSKKETATFRKARAN